MKNDALKHKNLLLSAALVCFGNTIGMEKRYRSHWNQSWASLYDIGSSLAMKVGLRTRISIPYEMTGQLLHLINVYVVMDSREFTNDFG
jgi:hypothetical protein